MFGVVVVDSLGGGRNENGIGNYSHVYRRVFVKYAIVETRCFFFSNTRSGGEWGWSMEDVVTFAWLFVSICK